jgi:peptide/nickel transport system substrate-binding protein
MQRLVLQLLAATSIVIWAPSLESAIRPHYGGMLHVEMEAAVRSLDPSEAPVSSKEDAARERLAGLVLERLAEFDQNGRLQPALAVSWQANPERKQWQFQLRRGVKLHDGSPLTPAVVASALARANDAWQVSAEDNSVVIRPTGALPEFPAELAAPRYSIFLSGDDGKVIGTGPFRVTEWQPGQRLRLMANDGYWKGRPFVDAIAVEMARAPRQQLLDLELGKADLVEIRPDDVRSTVQRGTKIWSSAPVQLMALVFERDRRTWYESRLREAIALLIDRQAIHNVLLQKQGEIAGGLLPQWISGYAFLFPIARDTKRALELASSIPAQSRRLSLSYDASDSLARAVAERISVNVREGGITFQVLADSSTGPAANGDLRLVEVNLEGVSPEDTLKSLARRLALAEFLHLDSPVTSEEVYRTEQALIGDFRVIPLVHLPQLYAVSPRVQTWKTPGVLSNGDGRLEDVWLKREEP